MADTEKPQDQEQPDAAGMGDSDDTYEPTTAQVNRSRVQGNGVGQKDIDYQRDPTRIPSAEQYGDRQ